MGEFYEFRPPPPEEQHKRLVALRQLTSRGIPCIMWAEDALCYVYSVATSLFDQQVVVPDELLEAAAVVLQEGRYVPTVPAWDYAEPIGPYKGTSPFPRSIRLRHLDIPENEPYKLEPLPGFILLLPQSYFALDVRETHRFQSLVPPLPQSNADILVPKYHTMLEGLVHFIMNPPTGPITAPGDIHWRGRDKHDIFIGYLTMWRVKYDTDGTLPVRELFPEEEKILSELQTEEARWYIRQLFWERKRVRLSKMREFKLQNDSSPSCGQIGSPDAGLAGFRPQAQSPATHMAGIQGGGRPYSTLAPSASSRDNPCLPRTPRGLTLSDTRLQDTRRMVSGVPRLLRRTL